MDIRSIRLRAMLRPDYRGRAAGAWACENTVCRRQTLTRTVPVDGLIDAAKRSLQERGQDARATMDSPAVPQGYSTGANFDAKLKRVPARTVRRRRILLYRASLQALDLVNATLLARGDTVIIERIPIRAAPNAARPGAST